MPNLRNGSNGDSNPGSLECESGILPVSHCVPDVLCVRDWFIHVSIHLLQKAVFSPKYAM